MVDGVDLEPQHRGEDHVGKGPSPARVGGRKHELGDRVPVERVEDAVTRRWREAGREADLDPHLAHLGERVDRPGHGRDLAAIDGPRVGRFERVVGPHRLRLVAAEEVSEHGDLRLAHRGAHEVERSAHLVGAVRDAALHHGLDERLLDRTAVGDGRPGHVEARQRDHEGESTLAVVPSFLPGIELARAYYEEVVAALIGEVAHAAGRLGWGSDVLGYDTERSTDHGWGPHLHVFVEEDEVVRVRARVLAGLPEEFRGWPTQFGWDDTPVQPWVEVTTLRDWLTVQLGRDVRPRPTTVDWLLLPQQVLLEVVAGAVFHDDAGELTALRRELDWYPDDLWLWLIACQWQRISQEESFVGRTAQVGDELGSEIVAARLAHDLMRLCFLLERRYAPYSKWFGTAFSKLDAAEELTPLLLGRELGLAYEAVARRHNALGLTDPVEPTLRLYYGRPFQVIFGERFVAASLEKVQDPWLRGLPRIGAIDQWSSSTDLLENIALVQRLSTAYDGG